MKASLQTKLLLSGILLVLLTTASISSTYYILTRQDKQQESRQRIRIAFDIIGDSFAEQRRTYQERFKEFLKANGSIATAGSVYKQGQKILSEPTLINAYLSKIAVQLKDFGRLLAMNTLAFYTSDKRLLAAYRHQAAQEFVGGYVVSGTKADSFLALDDPTSPEMTAIWMGNAPVPDQPLPPGIDAAYKGEIPNAIFTELFSAEKMVGVRITSPVSYVGETTGILVGEIFFTQPFMEHYALLSQAALNLFAGNQWSVGTLPAQTELSPKIMEKLAACQDILDQKAELNISPVTYENKKYYQGQCVFKNVQGTLGALTISFSQEIEQRAIRKILMTVVLVSVIVIAVAFALTVAFSRKSVRFIQQLITYIDRLSKGELPEKITTAYKGEFNDIKQNMNLLIDSTDAITRITEEIAHGNLAVDVTERSEHDRLLKAFNLMITRLNHILQETNTLVQYVQAGKLDTRGQTEGFEGGWRDLIGGVNSLIDGFVAPITTTAEALERISKGDIPDAVTKAYNGDFNAIKKNLNALITAMNDISRLAKAMAEGDLTVEVKERSERDTLMQALNAMIMRLKDVVRQVKFTAANVAVGSRNLSTGADQMSQGASEQAAASEEASSSMEQMVANIHQNADNAKQTEQIALKSADQAQEGGHVVAETVVAMKQIAQKIEIIQDIATQTRMLSLNATIEAARAQEHGKAFSVVAAEVRQLSEVTKRAAAEINELATSSLAVSDKADQMLNVLVPSIHKTAELVQEISAASHEQYMGTEQINKAIQQLDQVTQQNASITEEIASTAETLANQAEQLQRAMEFFKIGEAVLKPISDVNYPKKTGQAALPVPKGGGKQTPNDDKRRKTEEQELSPGLFFDQIQQDAHHDDQDAEFERY